MMPVKIFVDFSVFIKGVAFGYAHGEIELPHNPQIERKIVILDKELSIENTVQSVLDGATSNILMLSDLDFDNLSEAEDFVSQIETGLGLIFDRFD